MLFKKYVVKKGVVFASLCLSLIASNSAFSQQTAYQIVEGKNGTGIWLSMHKANLNQTSPNVSSAIEQNNLITSFTKASQLNNTHLNTPINQVNLRKTPALIGIDATSVSYKNAWEWGNQVIFEATYQTASRAIPWRSDYACDTTNACKLMVKPKPQFFELSYYMYANNPIVSKPASQLTLPNSQLAKYTVQFAQPGTKPTFNKPTTGTKSATWTLFLEKESSSINYAPSSQSFEIPPGASRPASIVLLQAQLNEVIKAVKIEEMLQDPSQPKIEYKLPLQTKGVGIFQRKLNANGTQSSSRLVYQEQIYNMITKWRSVNLVASLSLDDRIVLFVQPVIVGTAEQATNYLGAVYPFEIKDNKVTLGVSSDYTGALLSSDRLLESLRINAS